MLPNQEYACYRKLRNEQLGDKKGRIQRFKYEYDRAKTLAVRAGMLLTHSSEADYSLRHESGWILNIYPNHLCYDGNYLKGPFLNLPDKWTLTDVVAQAVKQTSPELGQEAEKEIARKEFTITEETIRERAYLLWEQAGKPSGDGVEFWLQAIGEIKGTHS